MRLLDVATLVSQHYLVDEAFLPEALCASLRDDAQRLRHADCFVKAKVGTRAVSQAGDIESVTQIVNGTRLSETCWLRPPPAPELGNVQARRALEDVVTDLGRTVSRHTGLELLEFQTELAYAYYPSGGYYKEHVDVPQANQGYYKFGRSGNHQERREFSLLLYLNDDWRPHHGGCLSLFGGSTVVEPRAGTLVIFRSDCVPHEVLKAHAERWAVVGWFRLGRPLAAAPIFDAGERLERQGFDAAAAELYERVATELSVPVSARAYAWTRRAHALFDGCDRVQAARTCYEEALDLESSPLALSGLGVCANDPSSLRTALDETKSARFALALASMTDDRSLVDQLRSSPDSHFLADTLDWLPAGLDLLKGTRSALEIASLHAPPGLVLEFGVYFGRSLRMLADLLPGRRIHGFDSFQGLPEDWYDHEPAGAYSTAGVLPAAPPPEATLHTGWFKDTLPPFLRQNPDADIALVHLDCDLYSSTKDVLDALGSRLRPGAVLVFDDFLAHPEWRHHQFKAFDEARRRFDWSYDILAASILTKQLVVRLQ